MSVINIIILVILALVLLWGLNNVFLKTNIIYDKMCDASINANAATDPAIKVTGTNIIAAKDIPDTTSSNFTLSVWFYIDNWNNNISNYKNILFMATTNNPESNTLDTVNGLSSKKVLSSTPPIRKNIGIGLDKYDNNLFIDIECYDSSNVNVSYTRYKIPNISIQKWNNLTMSVDGRTLDVYLDGKLRNSFIMHGLYRNSYGTQILKNIYLGNVSPTSTTSTSTNSTNSTNGFEGFITRIRFLGESCNPQDAYNFYKEGINASLANSLFNKYSLKVSFLEYNKEKGGFQI